MTYLHKGKKVKLHGIFQYYGVIQPSNLVGGHIGGQIAYPVAVIEHENGDIEQVFPYEIKGEK